MNIEIPANYSALYDRAPDLKRVKESPKFDAEQAAIFITEVNKVAEEARNLLAHLEICYNIHSNRHLGDAKISASECIKSIGSLTRSLQ